MSARYYLADRIGGSKVSAKLSGFGLHDAKQRPSQIDDEQLALRSSRSPHQLTADDAQRGSLSGLVVTEDQQM